MRFFPEKGYNAFKDFKIRHLIEKNYAPSFWKTLLSKILEKISSMDVPQKFFFIYLN